MAVTVTSTAKATDANSYVSSAEFIAYCEGRLDATEGEEASDEVNRALVMATARLEQEDYYGHVTDQDQRLKWPRSGLTDMDGRVYDQDVIPRPVKEATYELALELLKAGVELKNTGMEGFKSVTVGPITAELVQGFDKGRLPRQVTHLLRDLRVGYSGLNLRLSRG